MIPQNRNVRVCMMAVIAAFVTLSCNSNQRPAEAGGNPLGFIPTGGDLAPAATDQTCLNDASGPGSNDRFNNATCTANDVEIKRLEVVGQMGPIQCVEGTDFDVNLRAFFGLNSTERFDIAYFFATDGGDAKTGSCVHGFLEPIENGAGPDPLGGSGPFRDLENDASDICGDAAESDEPVSGINQGIAAILDIPDMVTLTCIDPDDDGFLEVGTCTSWDNNEQDTCAGVADAFPGTPAKCNCSPALLEIQITREAKVKVIKDLNPASDTGRFDLTIKNASGTQVAIADDAGDGDMAMATIQWLASAEPDSNKATVQELIGTPNPGLSAYDISYSCVESVNGQTSINDTGTGPQELTLANGDEWTCTFTNDRIPTLQVKKILDPTTDPGLFDLQIDGQTCLADAGHNDMCSPVQVSEGQHTVGELAGTNTDLLEYDATIGGDCAADGTVDVVLGDAKLCTITNTRRAMVTLNKRESGGLPLSKAYQFEIRSGASLVSSGTLVASGSADVNTGVVDFSCVGAISPDICQDNAGGIAKFVPGDYQVCEVAMMPGFSNNIDGFTPNGEPAEGADNSSECVNVTLNAGDMGAPTIPNVLPDPIDNFPPPGGDARTIGFWKNWTSCDGHGNQDPVLDDTLTAAGGTILLGNFAVDSCQEAVLVLDKRDQTGSNKKRANDACYGLAAQLLAAKLNVVAGAGTCAAVTTAIADGDQLLIDAGFDGSGKCLRPQDADYQEARSVEGTLDDYNNNTLCP